MSTNYIPVDSAVVPIDSNHITIEGADVLVQKKDDKPTRVEDYLGIGNPLIYR